MTVSNTTPLVENKTGNGVWTTIAVTPGLIFQNSDGTHAIKVIKTTIATGATSTLAETTDYTVTLDGTSPSTGTITIVAGAPSSAYRYTVLSNLTASQEVDLQNGTIVDMEDIEGALDKLTLLHQVQQEKLERAIILAEDTLVRNLTLDSLDAQAGKVIRVNQTEDGFDYTSTTTTISDGDYGDITLSSSGTVMTIDNSAITTAKINDAAVTTAKINDAAVTTAKINDDAVTLAKLAAGTAGNLITYDASGNPAAVATGTSGHILTSNGAGAAPTFQAPVSAIADTGIVKSVNFTTKTSTTDSVTANKTVWTDVTDLSVTFTPQAATNRALVGGQVHTFTGTSLIQFRVVKNGVPIGVQDDDHYGCYKPTFIATGGNGQNGGTTIFEVLDPEIGTTSSVTYKVQMISPVTVATNSAGSINYVCTETDTTTYIRAVSQLHVIEVN